MTKILKATSGRLFGRVSNGTGRAEELTPSQARTVLELGTLATQSGTFSGTSSGTNTGDQNLFSTIIVAGQSDVVADATGDTLTLVAGTNISITTNAGSDSITINNTASGLSGTGSVDNAVLRADGTGGATLQNSAIVIDDLFTASPNNTVNFTCLKPTGGTTNVGVSIVPKGTGAFTLAVPDGTTTGGNARGANAVDLQTARTAATQIASGPYSFAAGYRATASGPDGGASAIGDNVTASGSRAFACGHNTVASGNFSFAANLGSQATGQNAVALGGGTANTGLAWAGVVESTGLLAIGEGTRAVRGIAVGVGTRSFRSGEFALSNGNFVFGGDVQRTVMTAFGQTTDATPKTLFLDNSTQRVSMAAQPVNTGRIATFFVRVIGVKTDGTSVAEYWRRVRIKNVSGTTSLVGSVETIGTDYEDNAATDIEITADNTNDALQITVTGIAAETWRWQAIIEGGEIGFGT